MERLLSDARAIGSDVGRRFGGLSDAQLNWKPAPVRWSVAQCLDHLIQANREMHVPLDAVLDGTKQARWVERMPGYAAL